MEFLQGVQINNGWENKSKHFRSVISHSKGMLHSHSDARRGVANAARTRASRVAASHQPPARRLSAGQPAPVREHPSAAISGVQHAVADPPHTLRLCALWLFLRPPLIPPALHVTRATCCLGCMPPAPARRRSTSDWSHLLDLHAHHTPKRHTMCERVQYSRAVRCVVSGCA